MTMSNGLQRTLFAFIAGPAFLATLWAGGWPKEILLGLLLAGCTWEYFKILRERFPSIGAIPQRGLPILVFWMAWTSEHGPLSHLGPWRNLVFGALALLIMIHGFRRLPRDEVFPWIGLAAAGLAYLGGWGSSLFDLSQGAPGWKALAPLLLALGVCWSGDTFAYLVGKAIGKRKLCPQLSPAKTVEGAAAGIAAPALFGALWGGYALGIDPLAGLAIGAFLGFAGIVGDLLESVFKRWAGVKDSSQLLPGHGGLLDRFDSVLLVAPLLHFALIAIGR